MIPFLVNMSKIIYSCICFKDVSFTTIASNECSLSSCIFVLNISENILSSHINISFSIYLLIILRHNNMQYDTYTLTTILRITNLTAVGCVLSYDKLRDKYSRYLCYIYIYTVILIKILLNIYYINYIFFCYILIKVY